jgi:hypothetical protein
MTDQRRNSLPAGARIDIGEIAIELPALRGIDPTLFARHVELGLRRMELDQPVGMFAIDVLALPAITARPGDTAVTLAGRVCDALSLALAQRFSTGGGRP